MYDATESGQEGPEMGPVPNQDGGDRQDRDTAGDGRGPVGRERQPEAQGLAPGTGPAKAGAPTEEVAAARMAMVWRKTGAEREVVMDSLPVLGASHAAVESFDG
jgi:hypothetical protein